MFTLDPLPIYMKWLREGKRAGTNQRFGQYYVNLLPKTRDEALPDPVATKVFYEENDSAAYLMAVAKYYATCENEDDPID